MVKRVLFLIPNLAHGGAERVLVNLANNLNKTKFEVTVQTLFDVGVNRQYLQNHVHYISGFKYYFRGNSQLMKMIPSKWLYRMIIKDEYDIVVSYLEGPTARIVAACPNRNTKKISWIHVELSTPKLAAIGFINHRKAQQAYNQFDRIIAVSEQVKKVFQKNMPTTAPVEVLYNTNETEIILEKSESTDVSPVFKTGDIPVICSVAKLAQTKGFDRLLNVHKKLIDEGYNHRIYLLGIGEMQQELEKKISKYKVQDSFILLGFQDNPYKYVSKCDLYVCSSRREGFSTAVTEALIVGVPVISTDCSGAKELLGENNEYGIVVENSEEGIYTGIKCCLGNSELLAYYKKQAKGRGQFFSREKTVKAVEEMLLKL